MVTLADLDSLLIQKTLSIHMHVHLIYKIKYDVAQNTVYTSAVFRDVTKYKIISDT